MQARRQYLASSPLLLVLALVVHALTALVLVATALPFVRSDVWWVRAFDFPRTQVLLIGLAVLAARLGLGLAAKPAGLLATALLVAALAYQTFRILPYTPLWKKQVLAAPGGGARLRMLFCNVLMENREAAKVLALVRERRPDLMVLAEPDAWWREALRPLDDLYPHRLDACKDDTYGLLLLSRLPLYDAEIRYLVEPHLPSFHAYVRVGEAPVRLIFVHPEPPAPNEADDTTERDAELLIVARMVAERRDVPTVVGGDLNDVAWSQTTRLFQKVSRLLDPRRGRGLFATFHAAYPLLRWPLDHVFHSDHFTLAGLERLRGVGSDHFPIWVELEHTPGAEHVQEAPAADRSDQREATEKIAKGSA